METLLKCTEALTLSYIFLLPWPPSIRKRPPVADNQRYPIQDPTIGAYSNTWTPRIINKYHYSGF